MLFTIHDLISDAAPLVTVRREDTAVEARRHMIQNDYSQLPVVDDNGRSVNAAVTYRSILNALHSLGTTLDKLTVDDVMTSAHEVRVDADFLTVLDDIQDESFLLIVDADKMLRGIVTTFDTTAHFRRYAENLMVVEDVETMLREAIRSLYSDDEVAAEIQKVVAKKRVTVDGFKRGLVEYVSNAAGGTKLDEDKVGTAFACIGDDRCKTFEQLTFNELAEVLLRHPACPRPTLADGVKGLRKLLHGVRDTRNDLAHFRGEISAEQRDSLRYCSDWPSRHLPAAKLPADGPPKLDERTNAQSQIVAAEAAAVSPGEELVRPEDSTYAALAIFLKSQPPEIDSRTLTFEEIEKVIDYNLPKSARAHRAWWANDPKHPQAAQWLDVGWRAQGISMTEERVTFVRIADREEAYIHFFSGVMERLRVESEFPLRPLSPQGVSWHFLAELRWHKPNSANLNVSFTRQKTLRVEMYLDAGDASETKAGFDALHARKTELEARLGPLSWERMDTKRASRIAAYTPATIAGEPVSLDHAADWAARKAIAFYRAFKPEFERLTGNRETDSSLA